MFTITKQTDYALLTLQNLVDKKEIISLADLTQKTSMPKRLFARTTSVLANAGILESKEGKGGGYKLKINLKKISLYDFLKLFEKDLSFSCCERSVRNCLWFKTCKHKAFFTNKLGLMFTKQLKNWTLADVLHR